MSHSRFRLPPFTGTTTTAGHQSAGSAVSIRRQGGAIVAWLMMGFRSLTSAVGWAMSNRAGRILLVGLLAIDLILVGISAIHGGDRWSINLERSVPEVVQHLKELAIVIGCVWLARRRSSPTFMALGALFGWILLDDSLQYHERVGRLLARNVDLTGAAQLLGGIRPMDVGEMLSLLVPLTIFVPLLWLGFSKDAADTRQHLAPFTVGIALLVCFGVVIDIGEQAAAFVAIEPTLGHVENGGELLVMSLIVVYVFGLVWVQAKRDAGPPRLEPSSAPLTRAED